MEINLRLSIVIALLGWSSCTPLDPGRVDDTFFLHNDGADMPVWVRGSQLNRTYIIMLHGGPGGNSMVYANFERKFKEVLEERYAMVYWDQRGSGSAQGNIKESSLRLDQFTEDLYKLIKVLQDRYEEPRIFLMGHSWGGTLGTAFLMEEDYQAEVVGWIEVNGAHNIVLGYQLQRVFVMDRAETRIIAGEDVAKWERILAWCEDNPVIETRAQKDSVWQYMIAAGGQDNVNTQGPSMREYLNHAFTSPHSPALAGINLVWTSGAMSEHVDTIALSSGMHVIRLPVLILWGEKDGVTPVGLAHDAFNSVGTPDADKHMVIFENSGHSPMYDEPQRFVDEVVDFVEQYR